MTINIEQSVYGELADFIVSQPTLEDIAAYKVPPAVQEHINYLMTKNSAGDISTDERQELEKIITVVSLMDLAKAKAKLKMRDRG
jgi:hypothetical protein